MLTEKDKSIIEKYVDERFYNREKLIKYLSIHETVGNEVFEYCLKKEYASEHWNVRNSRWLEDEHGYQPLSVPRFLKRVPFYFFVAVRPDRRASTEPAFLPFSHIRQNKYGVRPPPADTLH